MLAVGYMILVLGVLSFQYKFTPVPSRGSVFVHMISAQNLYQSQSYRCEFIPVTVLEQDSHSSMKTHSNVM